MIAILAIGDKYYGNWAYNLALSIKANDSKLPILLIHDQVATRHYKSFHWQLFDVKTEMAFDHCWKDRRLEPGIAKLHLYQYLTEDTLYIDADSLCVKNPDPLFHLLKERDPYYVCQRVGTVNKGDGICHDMLWQTTDLIWERFNLKVDSFPATNTSFQYIKICPETEKLYADALYAVEHGWHYGDLNLQWGKSKAQPDELYMNIALAMNETDIGNYKPIYFTRKNLGLKKWEQVLEDHYFVGYWGDSGLNHRSIKELYDKLLKEFSIKVSKRRHEFKLHHLIKNKFLLKENKNVRMQ